MAALPPDVSALETRLGFEPGGLQGSDLARAVAALDDATAVVLATVPERVAEAWEADAPPLARVITLKAARREWENPQGLRSETLDGNGFTLDTATGVMLTHRERADLKRLATGRPGGFVGDVRTPSAYDATA